jgi:hypothetical protein
MRLFKRKERAGTVRRASSPDRAHLEEFAQTHRGVEGFVEPRTAVTETTMVLVAHDGEWTRRRVPSPEAAHALANRLGIPSYDAAVVGYPKRMREYNQRRAAADKAALRDDSPSGA